ncbi:MAG: MBL fold metallo-hydrolase [Planctomycetaceae bacterium]|jgi:glyoxylase-like metal-dependent hydrolase (beta-lactamase superfamily II)|nr:MBL fold metallo-hydrolase [Planctomycetaceae bacterium]
MQVDDWQLHTVSGGHFKVDGGTMFSVVPKPLWSRKATADELNRIDQATNCLLIRMGDKNLLIDTGYGSKMSDKQRRFIYAEAGNPLERSLAEQGVSREEIDTVVLTHLHFDHAGGVTRRNENGELKLEFPNAEHVIQQGEWNVANADWPELRGVYTSENYELLADSAQLRLIEGDVEIAPGVRCVVTGGHTEFHQAIVIEHGDEAFYHLADICPTSWNLPTAWCTGFDLNQLETRRSKRRLLQEISERDAWLLFDHDPELAAVKIVADDRGEFVVSDRLTTL